MTQFTVDPLALRDHAAAVRRIAGDVELASDAATEVGLGDSSFGVIGEILLLPLHGFFGDAGALVAKAGDLGDAYADGLEANSDVYQGIEDDAKSVLSKIHSDLIE